MNLEILRWWSTRENRPARRTFRARIRDQGGEDILLPSPLHSTPGKNSSGGEGRLLFRPLVMSDARRSRVGRESGVGNGQIGRFRGRAAAMLFLPWSKEKNERERESPFAILRDGA